MLFNRLGYSSGLSKILSHSELILDATLPEVAAMRISLALRTVFEVFGLEGQVLGLKPSRSSKIGRSSVEDSSFLLPFKSYISLKLF